jgi:acyl-CoA synthetase (NDP forming)/RimJ/RimL family protein N-acetyltransferase
VTAVAALDVILRDGTTLRLRPPAAGDADAVADLYAGLSPTSALLRFHGAAAVRPAEIRAVLDPDWRERGALVGTHWTPEGERIVALASWFRLRDPAAAEVAFAVADEFQGRGIGTRLLEQLAALAAPAGIERFVADVLAENVPMLKVFADAGFEEAQRREGDEVRVELRLAATPGYLAQVDERDHLAVTASLRPFFAPGSVAVAGASPREGTIGGDLFRNVIASGFPGPAYPVNRTGAEVAGRPGFTSFDDLPEPVDLAFVCVPAAAVLGVVESALRRGTRAVCVISAGFAELGPEGEARQDELLALVRAHGARLLGPNCVGIALADPPLNGTFAAAQFPPGNVAFCSQSGALGLALLDQAARRGLGFSAFVSVGNKADVSSNDLLEHWEDDERTGVVLCYLESFGNPRRFSRIARRVARRKPILALKAGTTGAGKRAAASHTAALAGSDAAVDALFRQAGVIRLPTLEELVDTAALLSSQPAPAGRRVALLTNAGGLAILCADACEAAGLEVAAPSAETQAALRGKLPAEASVAGPVDMLGGATAESYASALPLLLADPAVDAAIVLAVPTASLALAELEPVLAAADSAKPVLAVGLEPAPGSAVPRFAYPESAARALARAAQRTVWLERPLGTEVEPEGIDQRRAAAVVAAALARDEDVWLTPAETRELLDAYGIPFVPERDAASADEAVAAAGELGFPVAVKSAVPGAHKTEIGGVALGLPDEDSVREATQRIGPPVVVQPMAKGGPELIAGVVQDPVFGPLVAFGAGGALAELVGEASFALAPLTDADARELVLAGRAGKLVRGFRGAPPADEAALADLVNRLAHLAESVPQIAELDLNPVLALSEGCLALDARARVRRAEPESRARKTW